MATGLSLRLHLLSHEHSQKHDFDDCSICRQLLISPKKFATEPQTSLPDTEFQKDTLEFVLHFHVATIDCKPFDSRPPPSCT